MRHKHHTLHSLFGSTRRGTALALAVLLSVVLTAIIMCLALTSTIQSNLTNSLVKNDAVFYAAEYAMQDSLWRYKNDNTYRALTASPRTATLTLNGQNYTTVTTCQDMVGFPTIQWKFDDGSGSFAADNSGNGNTGTCYNTTWTNSSRQGPSALLFNGTDSYVNCGTSSSTNLKGNVTMSAWIKLTNASYDQKIGGNQDGIGGGYKFYIYNSKVIFEVRAADNTSTRNKNQPGGTVLAVNTWYHVAGLYSETNHTIKTYVNGKEEVSRRMTGLPANALAKTGSPNFLMGREPFANLYYFGGAMDDVRVYNSELSDADIAAMYNSAVEVHTTATLQGTTHKASAAVTAGIPLPAPPVLPAITSKGPVTIGGSTITGDIEINGNLSGSLSASTVDGDIKYAGTYTPGLMVQLNLLTNTLTQGAVTVPVPDYTSIQNQANQTYTGNQSGTTFKFTDLGGNKVIYVNGDVTNPQFDLTSGVFPSGGTLYIKGKLNITANCTIGNSTNAVYVITTDDVTQSAGAELTAYGGLYVGKNWNRRAASIYGPVVVQNSMPETGSNVSTFTISSVPWFDPRAISYNGAAALPMVYSSYHDDNN